MGKSVRVNLSLPEPLDEIYGEVARLTGQSKPQLLVDAIRTQAAYHQRWLRNFNYTPRDYAALSDSSRDVMGSVQVKP
jgi:hypothetical protein